MNSPPFPLFGEILALAAALGWAVAIVLFKRVGEVRDGKAGLGPVALNTLKNGIGFLLLIPTMPLLGESIWPDVSTRDLVLMLVSGFLGMGLSDTLFLAALNRLGASVWSIVQTLYAPLVVVLAWVFLGETLGGWQLLGVLLVVVALVLLAIEPKRRRNGTRTTPTDAEQRTRRDWIVGFALLVVGMLVMAASIIMLKPSLDRSPVLWATWIRLAGGLVFLLGMIAARKSARQQFAAYTDARIMRIAAPAGFIGTYLALIFLLAGLKWAGAGVGTVLQQLSNLFIFLLAVIFLREPTNARRWLGVVLGVGGAILVMLGRG